MCFQIISAEALYQAANSFSFPKSVINFTGQLPSIPTVCKHNEPIMSGELFVRVTFSHNTFCYSLQLLHGLETPKVLVCRNLCAMCQAKSGLDLYTDVPLYYADDDTRILVDLSLLKRFAQILWNTNSFHFQRVPNSSILTTTSWPIDNFRNFLGYQSKVVIIDVLIPAI